MTMAKQNSLTGYFVPRNCIVVYRLFVADYACLAWDIGDWGRASQTIRPKLIPNLSDTISAL